MWRDYMYPKSREELHKEYREAIKDINTHQALANFYSDPEDPHALPHQINWNNLEWSPTACPGPDLWPWIQANR